MRKLFVLAGALVVIGAWQILNLRYMRRGNQSSSGPLVGDLVSGLQPNLRPGEILFKNDAPARALIFLDEDPVLSATFPSRCDLNAVGTSKGELFIEFDLFSGEWPGRGAELILNRMTIARFYGKSELAIIGKRKVEINGVCSKNPQLKVMDDEDFEKLALSVGGLFPFRGMLDVDAIAFENRLDSEWLSVLRDGDSMKVGHIASRKSLQFVRGRRTCVVRVSADSIKNGDEKEGFLVKYVSPTTAMNLCESMTCAIDTSSREILVLTPAGWFRLLKRG